MKKLLLTLNSLLVAGISVAQVSFTTLPKAGEIYPRNVITNIGNPIVAGTVLSAASPYDAMKVKLYRNNIFQATYTQVLSYQQGIANFSLTFPIVSELANYKIEAYGSINGSLTLIASVDSLLAGDAFIITGQSNAAAGAVFGFGNADNKNSFIRVYGSGSSYGYTPEWFEANGDIWDGGGNGNCGQWGLRLAKDLLDAHSIPIALFNGANSGQPISWFQRNDLDPQDQNTNYGRLLSRVTETGFLNDIRAIFWYQGESNSFGTSTATYKSSFNSLNSDWLSDFPNYGHLYIIQIKQGCGATKTGVNKIQEAHRELAQEIANASIYASNGTNQASDICHYPYNKGYKITGDNMFNIVNRDIYGGPSNANIESPYVISAVQTASNQITLNFKNTADTYTWTNGTEKDFILSGSNVNIISGVVSGSSIILTLSGTPLSFTGLSYLGHKGIGSPTIRNLNGLGLVGFRLLTVTPFSPKLYAAKEEPLSIYPNPAAGQTMLSFQLTSETSLIISVYNVIGTKVFENNNPNVDAGLQIETLDLKGLAKGIYIVQIKTDDNSLRQKLIIE